MQRRVPSRSKGVDVLKLPLSTVEGFVLSLVDGHASVQDIAIMAGLDAAKLESILARLSELRAVELPWAPRKETPKPPPPAVLPDAHFAAYDAKYPARELDDTSSLSPELRRRILIAYYAMEGLDHYEVLGVEPTAEKETLRSAYFELSKVFHPDSQFGKDLGPFRTKMEGVFKRLTEAYDVLGKRKKRAEYDEYLATTAQTRNARRKLARAQREADHVREASRPLTVVEIDAATREALKPPAVPRFEAPARPRVEAPPEPAPSAPAAAAQAEPNAAPARPITLRPALSNEERRARVRERLRQRLKAAPSPPPPPSEPEPEPGPEQRRKSVIDGLRQSIRTSAAVTNETRLRVESHLRRARDAEQAGDALNAVSELQLALALDASNPGIQTEYARVSKVVARNLASNYEKQALYEEKVGNWRAAALSWGRVSDHRETDAKAALHAAEALLKSRGDLHKAQKYAQRAVELAGENAQNLTLLGRVYLAAGLKRNAQRELEKAVKLDPRDQMVNNLLREARS